MIPDPLEKTVLIPIRIRDGKLEFFYGGDIPKLKDDAVGHLMVPTYQVEDKGRLQLLEQETEKEFLAKSTHLFCQLNPNDSITGGPHKKFLIPGKQLGPPPKSGHFAEIVLHDPLVIKLRGTKKGELQDCRCSIPALPDEEPTSINHAYTLLSTFFEPHRRSHTGNVFDKVFFETKSNKWEPLKARRDHFEYAFERELMILCQRWWHKTGPEKNTIWALMERKSDKNFIVHCLRCNSEIYSQHYFGCEKESLEWIQAGGYREYKYEVNLGLPPQPRPPYKKNGEAVEFALENL